MISDNSCSSSSSISTFGDFLRSKNFDFNDNVNYSEFSIEFVAKMSKEKLIERFHFDKKLASEIHGLLAEVRKDRGMKSPPSNAKEFIKNFFKTKTDSPKVLDFFNPTETDYLGSEQKDHVPMDLLAALYSGHSEHFKQIIKRESKQLGIAKSYLVNQVTADGWTPLMYAAMLGRVDVCRFLLKNDANMKMRSSDGQTALMIASSYGHAEIIKIMVEFAAEKAKLFKNRISQEVVKDEILLKFADKNGFTALHFAAVYDQANALKILLGLGADPYVPDNEGMTPTDHASLLANKECLVELIKNGGKVYESNKAGKSVTQKSC